MEELFNQTIFEIQQNAFKSGVPIMRPQSLNILKSLVAVKQPKSVLEIGTAVGYSGLNMLKMCENANLTTIEKDKQSFEIAQSNFLKLGYQKQVNQILGDALEVLPTIKNKFDFIFLDGAKSQYVKSLPYLVDMLNKGGVLVADNVLFMGMVNGKVPVKKNKGTIVRNLKAFLQELSTTYKTTLATQLIDIEDGLTISVKL